MKLHGAELPDGWDYESAATPPGAIWPHDLAIIKSPCGGCVTVNMIRRVFALGYGLPSRPENTVTYSGRNWRRTIIEDACKHLQDAIK